MDNACHFAIAEVGNPIDELVGKETRKLKRKIFRRKLMMKHTQTHNLQMVVFIISLTQSYRMYKGKGKGIGADMVWSGCAH